MRSHRRFLASIGAGAFAALLWASAAYAHATYKSSDPADDSTVSSAPSEITAEFTEPMSGGSYMDVTDPCGRDSGSGSSQTGSSMRVQNSSNAAGTYVVFWRAVSIDSHITEGSFRFTAADGDPCPGAAKEKAGAGGSSGSGDSGSKDSASSSDAGGGSSAGSEAGSGGAGSGDSGGATTRGRHAGHNRGAKDGDRKGGGRASGRPDGGGGPLAGARSDVPDVPSAIEGIPLGGLVFTLVVAALIGAAAGKIYVSLDGDDS